MLCRGEGGGANSGVGTGGLDVVFWVPWCSCVSRMWWGTGGGQGSDVSRRRGNGGAEQPQEGCRWGRGGREEGQASPSLLCCVLGQAEWFLMH